MTFFKPAPSHNPLFGPAVCLCVDCCRIVAKLRCPAINKDGHQCGDYKHRGKDHSLIVMTTFQIVDERLVADQTGAENCERCGVCLLSEDGYFVTDVSGRHRYCDDCPAPPHPAETCPKCGGAGGWYERFGPDDNFESTACDMCGGTGLPAAGQTGAET